MELNFTIPLSPRTKKNSSIPVKTKKGKWCIIPSNAYRKYERECGPYLEEAKKNYCISSPINRPLNIQAFYYVHERRKVDISNLHSALHDILVNAGIIEDDNCFIVSATDGSRVRYSATNPRTEVYITDYKGELPWEK